MLLIEKEKKGKRGGIALVIPGNSGLTYAYMKRMIVAQKILVVVVAW